MAGKSHGKSRRKTPWDGKTELTPTQEFLRTHYKVEKVVNLAFSKSQISSLQRPIWLKSRC